MKPCTKCNTVKALDAFARNAMGKFGRQSVCKVCMAARAKASYDPAARAASNAAYYLANKGQVVERTTAWAKANRGKTAAYSRAWRAANPEKQRAATMAWRAANPEAQAQHYRANDFARRAKGYTKTAVIREAIQACRDAYRVGDKYLDAYTMELIDAPTIDHVVPLALGGANEFENFVLTSRSNNSRKRDQSLVMFLLQKRAG